jgi:hypothetical protein
MTEARFHLDVSNWFWFPLTSVAPIRMPQVAALLALWQVANLAGFAWAALQRRTRGSRAA